ncbi:hypothetical protein D3C81_973910 [compost metagenome]
MLEQYEVFYDRQAESCSAIIAGNGIFALIKAFKHFIEFFLVNSNSRICDDKSNHNFLFAPALLVNFDMYTALFGKFNGISNQVYQNLG